MCDYNYGLQIIVTLFRNKKIHLSKRASNLSFYILRLNREFFLTRGIPEQSDADNLIETLFFYFAFPSFSFYSLLARKFDNVLSSRENTTDSRRDNRLFVVVSFRKIPASIFSLGFEKFPKIWKRTFRSTALFSRFFFVLIFRNENFTRIDSRTTFLRNGVSEMIFFSQQLHYKKKSKLEDSSISNFARFDKINFPFYPAILILVVNYIQISRDV